MRLVRPLVTKVSRRQPQEKTPAFPYLPGVKHEGCSPAQLAGVDLQGLPWLQYVNLKLSEVT